MFKQILFVQWKALRLPLLPLTLAAFALPLAAVQGTVAVPARAGALEQGAGILVALQSWLGFFPALAAIAGTAVAMGVWAWDGQAKHVYALSLPMTRQRYVLEKLGAGAVLLAIPVAALWFGSILATASMEVPYGLNTYATSVAFRFLLASAVAYAAVFALAAWSGRGAVVAVTVVGAALLVSDLAVSGAAATFAPGVAGFSPTAWLLEAMLNVPGPFGVFSGNWALIDV